MDTYLPTHVDLKRQAETLRADGTYYEVVRRGPVETLIVGLRAGQAAGGDASWGDWDAEEETILMDSGVRVDLHGREVE